MKKPKIEFSPIVGMHGWSQSKVIANDEGESLALSNQAGLTSDENLFFGNHPDEDVARLFLTSGIGLPAIIETFAVGVGEGPGIENVVDTVSKIDAVSPVSIALASGSACWLVFRTKIGSKPARKIAETILESGNWEWYASSDLDTPAEIAADIVKNQKAYLWWD